MPRAKITGFCSVENCGRPIKSHGICQYHYNKKRLEENPSKKYAGVRGNPLYMIWFERKQAKLVCERWLKFDNFLWDVGAKPEGEYFFIRPDGDKLYGPDNFKWLEHLRRKENESAKDWNARKLANRVRLNPSLFRDRNIKRKYGLTREEYETKAKAQNFACEICKLPETSYDSRSNSLRNLAVDHNHKTGKIRDLLCWRCNGTIGRINEDLELVENIKLYLLKHKEQD